MSMRPSPTLCYGIEVPREKLKAFIDSISPEEDYYADDWSVALNERYKNQNLSITFRYFDWFSDLEGVVIYIKSFGTYDYGEVLKIDPEDVSANSTNDLLSEMVLVNVQRDLGVPVVPPKWFFYAEFG